MNMVFCGHLFTSMEMSTANEHEGRYVVKCDVFASDSGDTSRPTRRGDFPDLRPVAFLPRRESKKISTRCQASFRGCRVTCWCSPEHNICEP